jgi:hypothetical protein
VPRRINAWCDLAMVAGYAEGRHEIDAEFIDFVISAQGGSLEGAESEDSSMSEDLTASAGIPPTSMPVSHNGLETAVGELSARLTRLEGLVLEMTSQLVPALTNIALKQSVKPGQPSEYDIVHHNSLEPEKTNQESVPPPRQNWLSRLFSSE